MTRIEQLLSSGVYFDVLGTLPIGMCLVGPNYRYKEVNEAWAEMLGYSASELQGMSFVEITYPPDRLIDEQLSLSLFNEEISHFTIKKRWIRKDGSLLRGIMTAFALTEPNAEPSGIAIIVPDHADTIDKKRTQEVVHDLRGLLNSVQMASSFLSGDPKMKPYGQAISAATGIASALTNSLLLTDSSPEGTCNAHRVINNCLAIISASLPPSVILRSSCVGAATVAIEEIKLSELILNLLTNARDAVQGEGVIDVSCHQEDKHVVLCVSDDGIGMSSEQTELALQEHYSTKGKLGTGLGLFISKNLLEDVGGSLKISSDEGSGTVVQCLIPIFAAKDLNPL